MFAEGYLSLYKGNVERRLHQSEALNSFQRRVYAFGTTQFGERLKLVAVTKIIDRNGNVVSEGPSDEK